MFIFSITKDENTYFELYKASYLFLVIWWITDKRIHFHTLKNIIFYKYTQFITNNQTDNNKVRIVEIFSISGQRKAHFSCLSAAIWMESWGNQNIQSLSLQVAQLKLNKETAKEAHKIKQTIYRGTQLHFCRLVVVNSWLPFLIIATNSS